MESTRVDLLTVFYKPTAFGDPGACRSSALTERLLQLREVFLALPSHEKGLCAVNLASDRSDILHGNSLTQTHPA